MNTFDVATSSWIAYMQSLIELLLPPWDTFPGGWACIVSAESSLCNRIKSPQSGLAISKYLVMSWILPKGCMISYPPCASKWVEATTMLLNQGRVTTCKDAVTSMILGISILSSQATVILLWLCSILNTYRLKHSLVFNIIIEQLRVISCGLFGYMMTMLVVQWRSSACAPSLARP